MNPTFPTHIILTAICWMCLSPLLFATDPDTAFPDLPDLPENVMMPNPFQRLDGSGPVTQADWPRHREYLKSMMQHYLYGHLPPKPEHEQVGYQRLSAEFFVPAKSTVEAVKEEYAVTITRAELQHTFEIEIWRPKQVQTYPTIINVLGKCEPGCEEALRRGYIYVHIRRRTVAPDHPRPLDRQAGIFRLYAEYDWHTIAAWAWSYQVVIDVVDRLGLLDHERIVATGHSRGGQTAIAAAIFDERIDVVAPCTGGFWSVGSHRQRDLEGVRGTHDLPYWISVQQPHWYHPRYWEFGFDQQELQDKSRMNRLPWDASTFMALVAPRPICHLNAVHDPFNNALAQEAGIRVGRQIYRWWGRENRVRIHWRGRENRFGQPKHDFGMEEYLAMLDFCDEYFFGDSSNETRWNVAPGKDGWLFDPAEHPLMIDWDVPDRGLGKK